MDAVSPDLYVFCFSGSNHASYHYTPWSNVFSLKQNAWYPKGTIPDLPRARFGCSLYHIGSYIVLCGGIATVNSQEFASSILFDLHTGKWMSLRESSATSNEQARVEGPALPFMHQDRQTQGYARDGMYVYVTGGHGGSPNCSENSSTKYLNSCERLNVLELDAGWERLPRIPMGQHGRLNSAAIVGRTLYCVGGHGCMSDLSSDWIDEFDLERQEWRPREQCVQLPDGGRTYTACCALRGRLVIIGGMYRRGYASVVHSMDPLTHEFRQLAPIPVPRSQTTAIVIQDRFIVCVAGYTATGYTDSVVCYDADIDKWASLANYPQPSSYVVAATVDASAAGVPADALSPCHLPRSAMRGFFLWQRPAVQKRVIALLHCAAVPTTGLYALPQELLFQIVASIMNDI